MGEGINVALWGIAPPLHLEALLSRRRAHTVAVSVGIALIFGGILGFVTYHGVVGNAATGLLGIALGASILVGGYLVITRGASLDSLSSPSQEEQLDLNEWSAAYPDIRQYLLEVREQNRPLTLRDYRVIGDWVDEQDEIREMELANLACGATHGV